MKLIQIDSHFWFMDLYRPIDKSLLGIISQKRKILVTEKFIESLVEKYGKHAVFINGGTWDPEVCNFLFKRIAYHLEKNLMERVTLYLRTEPRV